MNRIVKSLLALLFVSYASTGQVRVLKSTESLCRSEPDVIYYTAYDCDGAIQWLNFEETPIGSGNASKDTPGFPGINNYFVKCGNGAPINFQINNRIDVKSSQPTISASNTTINAGDNVNLTASNCTGSISWMSGDYVLATGTNTHTVNPTVTTTYYALCTESNKCVSDPSTQTISVSVNNPFLSAPTINTLDRTGCLPLNQNTIIGAYGCFYTVQWFNSSNTQVGTGPQITVNPTSNTDSYYASCTNGTTTSPSSNVLTAGASGPAITAQPLGKVLCEGDTYVLSVTAANVTGYQWKKDGANLSGATFNTFTITAATNANAGTYSVEITGACGNVTSGNAIVTVINKPVITTQPVAATKCVGEAVTFSVAATNAGTYQWRKNGANISGETNSSLTFTSLTTADAASYDVIVNGDGACATANVTSSAAALNVNTPVSITTQPLTKDLCEGDSYILSVTANGTISGYQWKKDGNNLTGANATTFNITAATNTIAGTYSVEVIGACGNVTSSNAIVTVINKPIITTQPLTTTKCVGETLTLSVSATSAGTYQWRKNGTNISGETNSSLTFTSLTTADAASYDVIVNGDGACATANVTSSAAVLNVNTPVSITTQPIDKVVCEGTTQVLSVSANGTITGYQWKKDGANLTGATFNTFTITDATGTNTGIYSVEVIGACGNLQSNPVQFTVDKLTIDNESVTAPTCFDFNNGSIELQVSTINPDISYSWTNNNSTSNTASNISAGVYQVSIVNSTSGCSVSKQFIVGHPSQLASSFTSEDVSCFGGNDGTIAFTVSGGTTPYTFSVNGQSSALELSGLNSRNYDYIVTDKNGCATNGTVEIKEPTELNYTSAFENVNCFGGDDGQVEITPTGGTAPYALVLNSSRQGSTSNKNLGAGTYTISATDSKNCASSTREIQITQPQSPVEVAFLEATQPRGFGFSDGTVSFSVQGGSQQADGYAVVWGGAASGTPTLNQAGSVYQAINSNTKAGQISIQAFDENYAKATNKAGCTAQAEYTLNEPPKIVAQLTQNQRVSCFGKSDARVQIDASGGVPFAEGSSGYRYKWKRSNSPFTKLTSSNLLTNIAAGDYEIEVIDKNEVSQFFNITIEQPTAVRPNVLSLTKPTCDNTNDGEIEIEVLGGSAPYEVTWNGGLQGTKISELTSGKYFGIIKDVNGCFGEVAERLESTKRINATVVETYSPLCEDICDGFIKLEVDTEEDYQLTWSNGASGLNPSNLCSGEYTGVIKTTTGCETIIPTIQLNEPRPFQIEVSDGLQFCTGYGTSIDASRNDGDYEYLWKLPNGSTSSSPQLEINTVGAYEISLINTDGCTAKDAFTVDEIAPQGFFDFAMSSNGFTNETINAVNLSGVGTQVQWKPATELQLTQNDASMLSFQAQSSGNYEIELVGSDGNCEVSIKKQIQISEAAFGLIPETEEKVIGSTVFPNPPVDNFFVKYDTNDEEFSVMIADESQRLLFSKKYKAGNQNIIPIRINDLNTRSREVYVTITSNSYQKTHRVILSK